MILGLKNKRYLVSGVSSGIGKETTIQLLRKGAFVYGLGRIESKVEDIKKEFSSDKFIFFPFDLEKISQIDSLVNLILSDSEKLDGMVLSAGKEETLPLISYRPDKMESIFKVNFLANAELIRVFSKKKYSQDNSSIVIVSSVMSILGQPAKVGYCSSKAAILGLVKSAALELAKRRIRINAISPGVVQTPMTDGLFNLLSLEQIEEIRLMHPLGFGHVTDIYPSILFLLSDSSGWITGQNIIIDGGYSIH